MRIGRLLQLLRRRQDRIDIAAGLTMAIQLPHRHDGEGSRRGRLRRRLQQLAAGHKKTKKYERSRFHRQYVVRSVLSLPDHFAYCQDFVAREERKTLAGRSPLTTMGTCLSEDETF